MMVNPQAAVDSIDWARERNEHGIYRMALRDIQEKAAEANASMIHGEMTTGAKYPRCEVDPSPSDYPITFAILGMEYGVYHPTCNAIEYPLGDHEILELEMRHAIARRANLDKLCLEEMFAHSPPIRLNDLQ